MENVFTLRTSAVALFCSRRLREGGTAQRRASQINLTAPRGGQGVKAEAIPAQLLHFGHISVIRLVLSPGLETAQRKREEREEQRGGVNNGPTRNIVMWRRH